MRIVFIGTADFAVPSLRQCAAHHAVAAVVTQPERSGDRGRPAPRPVRDIAHELGISVLAPPRIRDPEATEEVLAQEPECVVVAAYGQILPQPLLQRPRFGAVNVHASLLPRWRGAAPVAHAILAGDGETGVSIMQMDAGLDTGPVYQQQRLRVPEEATTPLLTGVLAGLGGQLLIDVLKQLERGAATATPQPEAGVTLAPRLKRADGALEWEQCTAVEIDRHVRALQPWPGVSLPLAGLRVRVLEGCVSGALQRSSSAPGMVVERDGEAVLVQSRDGLYRIDRVIPPGKRPMTAAAFLRGHRGHQ